MQQLRNQMDVGQTLFHVDSVEGNISCACTFKANDYPILDVVMSSTLKKDYYVLSGLE